MKNASKRAVFTLLFCLLAVILSLLAALFVIPFFTWGTPRVVTVAPAGGSEAVSENAPSSESTAEGESEQAPASAKVYAVTDTVFENDRAGVPVSVVVPDEGEGWSLVVLCHGFTGNREGDGHFAPLQQQLAAAGIASVAPDFAGCGQSSEPSTDYTLATMQADVDACVRTMAEAYPVNTERLGLVGHSMGGRLASLYLADGTYPVAAAALWSPANGAGLHGLEFLDVNDFGHVGTIAEEAKANGSCAAGSFSFIISDAFVTGMEESNPNDILAASNAALLLCYTGHEDLFSADTLETTTATVTEQGGVIITEPFAAAGHNYTAYGDETNAAANAPLDEALRGATLEFLKESL